MTASAGSDTDATVLARETPVGHGICPGVGHGADSLLRVPQQMLICFTGYTLGTHMPSLLEQALRCRPQYITKRIKLIKLSKAGLKTYTETCKTYKTHTF